MYSTWKDTNKIKGGGPNMHSKYGVGNNFELEVLIGAIKVLKILKSKHI